jgi:hypothetical protein
MASDMIDNIRKELQKIKALRKKSAEKLTAESLKVYKGFEDMSLERRQQFVEAVREFASIAVRQINRLIKPKI